jgi:hypothetical protein
LFHTFLLHHHLFTRTDEILYCHPKPSAPPKNNPIQPSQVEEKFIDWEAEILAEYNRGYQAGLHSRQEMEEGVKRYRK